MIQLLLLAKSPAPGQSKTRLTPPLSHAQAALLAEASLRQTLATVMQTPASRRVLVLKGPPGSWLPRGIEVLPQRGCGLDERLTNAFHDAGSPSLLIGMDTPQITPKHLSSACEQLMSDETDAVLGQCHDGGWWALGVKNFDPQLFSGIVTSTAQTGRDQLKRLQALGFRTQLLGKLRDVDTIEDARAVAALVPGSHFAAELARINDGMVVKA